MPAADGGFREQGSRCGRRLCCAVAVAMAVIALLILILPVRRRIGAQDPVQRGAVVLFVPAGCILSPESSLVVTVYLNGGHPARMILDTGSDGSLLSEASAARLGLSPFPVHAAQFPRQLRNVGTRRAVVTDLQFGPARLPRAAFLLVSDGVLDQLDGAAVDGLLGTDVLAGTAIGFDFQHSELTVWPHGGISLEDLRKAGFHPSESLPMTDADPAESAFVSASFNGRSIRRVLLDTGGCATNLDPRVLRALGVKTVPGAAIRTLLGTSPMRRATLRRISLGSLTLYNWPVECSVDPSKLGLFQDVLGLDALMNFRVVMDFLSRRVYLQRVHAVFAANEGPLFADLPLVSGQRNDYPAVVASLRDGKPHRLALDLSSAQTALKPSFQLSRRGRAHQGSGTTSPARVITASLNIPILRRWRRRFALPLLNSGQDSAALPKGVDGILGADILKYFGCFYSIRWRRLELASLSLDRDFASVRQTGGGWAFARLIERVGYWEFKASVDNHPVWARLDAISPVSTLISTTQGRSVEANDGAANSWHTVRVGKVKWRVRLGMKAAPGVGDAQLILGADFLSRSDAAVDFSDQKLYLSAR